MSAPSPPRHPTVPARLPLRRAGFVAVACILAAALEVGPGPEALGWGMLAALAMLALSPLLARLGLRPESLSTGAVLGALVPLPLHLLPGATLVGALLVQALLHGRGSGRLGPRFDLIRRQTLISPLSADRLWRGLVPGASHPDDHFSGRMIDFDRDRDDLDTIYLRMDAGEHRHIDMTATILEQEALRRCRYVIEQNSAEMTVDLEIRPSGAEHHRIDCRIARRGLTLGQALDGWFGGGDLDFALGRNLHGLQPDAASGRMELGAPRFGLGQHQGHRASA